MILINNKELQESFGNALQEEAKIKTLLQNRQKEAKDKHDQRVKDAAEVIFKQAFQAYNQAIKQSENSNEEENACFILMQANEHRKAESNAASEELTKNLTECRFELSKAEEIRLHAERALRNATKKLTKQSGNKGAIFSQVFFVRVLSIYS